MTLNFINLKCFGSYFLSLEHFFRFSCTFIIMKSVETDEKTIDYKIQSERLFRKQFSFNFLITDTYTIIQPWTQYHILKIFQKS